MGTSRPPSLELGPLPAALLVVDDEGGLVDANREARRLLGHDQAWTPSGPLAATALQALAQGRVEREVEVSFEDRRLVLRARALPSSDGEHALLALEDLTGERQRVEAALHQEQVLQEAQEVADVGSWEWDVRADEVEWSDELYRIFGRDPEAFEGTFERYLGCIHPEDVEQVQATIEEALGTGEPFTFDHRIVRSDDEVRHLRCRGEVMRGDDGRPSRMVGTALDVTERRKAARQLQSYATRLEEANRELRHFANMASHDLKEPARTVTSYAQMLERHLGDELDETAAEYIAYIQQGSRRMTELIDDLLAYARLARARTEASSVELDRLVDEVTRELSDTIDAANAEIETRGLQTVAGDRTGLSLVLQNLVSNAIKFQEPDEPAHVGIELEREGANWHLVVEDDGIGFDPKYSDRIFRMFERLEGPGERPGTGIGLAICRKVVEAHGGRIWAESEPGEGTAVHVRLPVEPDLPEEDEEELGPPPGLRPGQGPV